MKIKVNTKYKYGELLWAPGWKTGVKNAVQKAVMVEVVGVEVSQTYDEAKQSKGKFFNIRYRVLPVDDRYSLVWDATNNEAKYQCHPFTLGEAELFQTHEDCEDYINAELPF